MSAETYAPPVAKLLAYGEPEPVLSEDWPNYLELGIGPEHIPDLTRVVADKDLRTTDDEWAIEELPDVYGLIGPAAIPLLAEYVAEPSHGEFPLDNAVRGIEKIGMMHPEAREEAIKTLTGQLERFEKNDYSLNAALIGSLGDLKATETLPFIEQAFGADRVDESI